MKSELYNKMYQYNKSIYTYSEQMRFKQCVRAYLFVLLIISCNFHLIELISCVPAQNFDCLWNEWEVEGMTMRTRENKNKSKNENKDEDKHKSKNKNENKNENKEVWEKNMRMRLTMTSKRLTEVIMIKRKNLTN